MDQLNGRRWSAGLLLSFSCSVGGCAETGYPQCNVGEWVALRYVSVNKAGPQPPYLVEQQAPTGERLARLSFVLMHYRVAVRVQEGVASIPCEAWKDADRMSNFSSKALNDAWLQQNGFKP